MPTPSDTGTDTKGLSAAARQALARGSLYRLLAQGFRDPVGGWWQALDDAVRETLAAGATGAWQDPEDSALLEAAERLLESLPGPDAVTEIADLHRQLFGHTAAGVCPLYETQTGSWSAFQQPHTLADLAGTYRAFGLVPSSSLRERPDHITLECEFGYVLSHKEAWAREHDGPEEVDLCVEARRLFLSEHLGRWAPSLAERLREHAPDSLYARLGTLLVTLVSHEARHLGFRLGDTGLPLGSESPTADACASCPQGAGDEPRGQTGL